MASQFHQLNNCSTNYNNINNNIYHYNNRISINITYNNRDDADGQEVAIIELPQSATNQNVPIEIEIPQIRRRKQKFQRNLPDDLIEEVQSFEEYDEPEFYNEKAVDVPEDFEKETYLVFDMQKNKNRHFKRRITTPTRNLKVNMC